MSLTPGFVSLRIRFMVVAVVLTIGSSAIWGGWTWQRERSLLFEKLSREGEQLVSTMTIPVINALLYEELGIIREGGLLDNFIGEIMSNSLLQVRYALVLDRQGKVLAHNRYAEYGNIYDDPLSRQALDSTDFVLNKIRVDNERVADLSMPLAIAGKRWGCLRVGVSMEPAFSELRRLERQIGLFLTLFSAGALILYWFIGNWLARPIVSLTRSMEHVGTHEIRVPPISFRRDEIGQLQRSFIEMVERLNDSEKERQSSVTRMLENERITTVGRIVSGVAHEVNNPLAGIEAVLYQLEKKTGPEAQRYLGLIRQSIERIGRIVGQLSDLSRVGEVHPRPIDCRDFFEDLALFAKMALKSRGCKILAENRCRELLINLDRDKINQVVLNLVLNAADAAGPEGAVTLRSFQQEHQYIIEVEDDGPGVPEEIVEQMFGPFFTTKEPGKGSGMGLTISRGIVDKHNGTLSYRPGKIGAVFSISIPTTDMEALPT